MVSDIKADFYEAAIDARISALVGIPARYAGNKVAIISHGLNAGAKSPHIQKIYDAYLQTGYAVVVPNLSNSNFNDSAGDAHDFTIGGHIADVRSAIEWARLQAGDLEWDGRKFSLAGHSMGGLASCYLAAREYAHKTSNILAVSPTTSGVRSIIARMNSDNHPDGLENLARDVPHALSDWPQYSLYDHVDLLTMPVAVIVGADDTLTTPRDIEDFCEALPNCTGKMVVTGEHHCLIGEDATDNFIALLNTFGDEVRGPQHKQDQFPLAL